MGILKNLLVTGSARFVNTIKGTVEKADELSTARSIQTNLASTTATFFDGSENITPGVTGTLDATHGGTGQTSLQNAGNAMLNALTAGDATPVDADYYISQTVGGGTTNTTYHRRPMSALWTYIKTKVEALGYTKNTGTITGIKMNGASKGTSGVVDLGTVATTDTNNRRSFFGTCATAAATAEKVVTLADTTGWELVAGVIIGVKFTYTNTASNVKLNVNSTGAKSIWWDHAVYTGNNNGITGYADRIIYYMYDGTNWVFINHSQNFANNYDTYDRTYLSNNGYKAKSAIVSQNIIVAGTDGLYFHLKTGNTFDITYPILFANSACAANVTNNSAYTIIPFTVTTTQSITLTAYKAVYIKGHLVGTTFTPVSTTPLTQTVPTSADGYQYILLGRALNSTTVMYLLSEHPIYEFTDGSFHLVGDRQTQDSVIQVPLANWSSSTSTVNGGTYYTCAVTLSKSAGTGDYKPRISIEPTPGNTLPTEAEQNAYDLLKYATVDNKTLTLYATVKPISSFYITLSEVSKVS